METTRRDAMDARTATEKPPDRKNRSSLTARRLLVLLWFALVFGWYFTGYFRSLGSYLRPLAARIPAVKFLLGDTTP